VRNYFAFIVRIDRDLLLDGPRWDSKGTNYSRKGEKARRRRSYRVLLEATKAN
jgi:hypothetical protein